MLVLDDIWNGNAECWEQLLLPFNHGFYGSKIIVTTREKEVAYHVLKSTKLFDLQQLDKSDCWSLFVTHAFQGKSVCEYPNLESIGKKILDKCGGLPLAVKSMGQLLRRNFSQHEWIKILETNMWRLSDAEHSINSVLRLSYHNLPSILKHCFSYCSIFPKGYEFEKGELIKLWMAEGLLKCCGSHKSEEELGNEIFGDLESISFFQRSNEDQNHFAMHDLVNDLARSVSGEFCVQIEGARVEGIFERTRHIRCYLRSNRVDKLIEPLCELRGLRSLILKAHKNVSISNNVQHDLFSRLKCLRMLSFRSCGLSELVDEISNLKVLRYLDLSYTLITSLPDTICMLYNLQTLLLERCNIRELPSNFSKLVNLRHLKLPYETKMPKHVGKLVNLQSFPYFIMEKHNGADLKELEKLNHLHGKIHIKGLGNVIDPLDAVTANLKDKKYFEFENSKYKGNSFPNWISRLPNLVSLQLRDCKEIKIIGADFYGNNSTIVPFRSLEVLEFKRMDNWEEWIFFEGFPLLKKLFISECPELKRALPQHLPSLQKLSIDDCDKLFFGGNRHTERKLINFTFLQELYLDFTGFVECPSLDLRCYNSLRKLSIKGWRSSSLPLELHMFTNLDYLRLCGCPELESFPRGGFPSHLTDLVIFDCPKLIASREQWGLFQLNSLEFFTIRDEFENVESFPEENLLPPTLRTLGLYNCSKLNFLPPRC